MGCVSFQHIAWNGSAIKLGFLCVADSQTIQRQRSSHTPGQLSVIFSHANVAKDGGLAVDFTGRPGN